MCVKVTKIMFAVYTNGTAEELDFGGQEPSYVINTAEEHLKDVGRLPKTRKEFAWHQFVSPSNRSVLAFAPVIYRNQTNAVARSMMEYLKIPYGSCIRTDVVFVAYDATVTDVVPLSKLQMSAIKLLYKFFNNEDASIGPRSPSSESGNTILTFEQHACLFSESSVIATTASDQPGVRPFDGLPKHDGHDPPADIKASDKMECTDKGERQSATSETDDRQMYEPMSVSNVPIEACLLTECANAADDLIDPSDPAVPTCTFAVPLAPALAMPPPTIATSRQARQNNMLLSEVPQLSDEPEYELPPINDRANDEDNEEPDADTSTASSSEVSSYESYLAEDECSKIFSNGENEHLYS